MTATRYRCTSASCPWEGPPPADGLGRATSHRDPTTGRRRDLAPHERGTFAQRPYCPVCGEGGVVPVEDGLLGPAETHKEDPVAKLRRDWEAREADRDRREAERDAAVQRELDALRAPPPPVAVPVPQGPQPAPIVHDKFLSLPTPLRRGRLPWRPILAAVVLAAGIVAGAGLGPAWLPVAARVVAAVVPLVQQAVVEDTAALPVPGPDAVEEPAP